MKILKSIFILSVYLLLVNNTATAATFNIPNGDITSLINAINTANSNNEADIINLATNGLYSLNSIYYTSSNPGSSGYEGQRGLPFIAKSLSGLNLTLNGNGATIERANGSPNFGLFTCSGYTIFNNLTLRNAIVNAQGAAIFVSFKGQIEVNNCNFLDNTSLINVEGGGGAVYTKSLSILNINDCYFENNKAYNQGGAISNLLSDLTVINCTFKSNTTTSTGNGSCGGAVYIDGARGDNGKLIFRGCTFDGNISTAGQGGGMFSFPYRNQTMEVTNCTFKNNKAVKSGGIWHKGGGSNGIPDTDPLLVLSAGVENTSFLLTDCVFDANEGEQEGGGMTLLEVRNVSEITKCTFKNNKSGLGGALFLVGDYPITISNSTFNNNTANQSGAIFDGVRAAFNVNNCTFAYNIANQYGGAMSIPQNSYPVNITNCTFAYNQANNSGNGQSGAIHSGTNGTNNSATIKNSIFYENTVTNPWGVWKHCNAVLNNGGNNMFFPENNNPTGQCVTNPNIVNPLLGPLADNGGPTQTMALLAGSPAINTGSGCPTLDQRGAIRVGNCDVGAFEYVPALPVTLTNFAVKADGRKAKIEWSTTSESNSNYFEILKSIDGYSFSSIGKIKSKNNGIEVNKYMFYDNQPSIGPNYYKLLQHDVDGRSHDKGIRTLDFDINISRLTVYPNPVFNNKTTVEIPAELNGKSKELSIVNLLGGVVMKTDIDESSQKYSLNLSEVQKGAYFILIKSGELKFSTKIFVH